MITIVPEYYLEHFSVQLLEIQEPICTIIPTKKPTTTPANPPKIPLPIASFKFALSAFSLNFQII